MKLLITIAVGLCVQFFSLQAEIKVADIFSSNMVLQSSQPIPVWGWGKPGEIVEVSFNHQVVTAKVNDSGSWRCELEPEQVSKHAKTLVVKAQNTIVFNNVLVGEVWFASGQSNMEWGMKQTMKSIPIFNHYVKEYELLRYREIKTKESLERKSLIGDGKAWTVFSPTSIPEYSAVCFFTALELYKNLDVPIGIIETAWGGHPIEPFIPVEAFTDHPVLKQELALGNQKDFKALKEMVGGVYARNESWLPGTIYNSRIAPVTPYAIKGALWYQAESNCGKSEDPRFYSEKMKALMRGWRGMWDNPNMPIYYVQLPQFDSPNWVRMREEQRLALTEPHTGMAVINDLYPLGIHPSNKLDVAKRLALWPLAKQYGKKIPFSGPMYKHSKVINKRFVVYFDHVEPGLAVGIKVDLHETYFPKNAILQGFEICEKPGSWVKANAEIKNNRVICSHPDVPNPIGVRYAWGKTMPDDFKWNLYNKAGLPASPFISNLDLAPFELDGQP